MRTRVVGGRKAPEGSQAGRKRTQKGREERRKENFYIGFSRMGLRLRLRLRLPRSSWLPTFPAFGTREKKASCVRVREGESSLASARYLIVIQGSSPQRGDGGGGRGGEEKREGNPLTRRGKPDQL